MIHCVLGFPSITAQDVYEEFQAQKVRFGWKHESNPYIHRYEAFISSIELLYTVEGLIFIEFKPNDERKHVTIADQHCLLHEVTNQGSRILADVIIFRLYEMNGSGQVSRFNPLKRIGTMKRDKFDLHVYEKLDNFIDLPQLFNK